MVELVRKTSKKKLKIDLYKERKMTKEVVKHRKEEKKKPLLSAKEKKAKKQEKKGTK